ncbi:hypothetical protein AAMO2058_001316000 [Amorphochlora amoebiformis]
MDVSLRLVRGRRGSSRVRVWSVGLGIVCVGIFLAIANIHHFTKKGVGVGSGIRLGAMGHQSSMFVDAFKGRGCFGYVGLRDRKDELSRLVPQGWAVQVDRIPYECDVGMDGTIVRFDGKNTLYVPLNNKGIKVIPAGVFEDGESVTTLDLENNKIHTLPDGAFHGLDNLQELKLSGNIITHIHPNAFQGLGSLQTLSLARNPIQELPVGVFSGCPKLTTLTLHSVALKSVDPGVFKGLTNLNKLHMYNTDIDGIPKDVFRYLPNLKVLSIHMGSRNKLPEGLLDNMPNLEELSVDGDALPLQDLDDGETSSMFESQRNLRFVYLFGDTTEEIFLKVRAALADANNCKVIVQGNPNMGPGYSFT